MVIHILEPNTNIENLPKQDEPYHIVTSDGLYIWKKGSIGPSITPRKEFPKHIGNFGDYKGGILWYQLPKIPANIIGQTVSFFRQAFEKFESEAQVIILYNEDAENKFNLLIPQQECSAGSVDYEYDPKDVPLDWQVLGSIHSHCDFSAFHSGTDTKDAESSTNGLHITIGMIDKDIPEFDAMVSIDGVPFNFEIERVADLEGWQNFTAPGDWLDCIKLFKYAVPKIEPYNWINRESVMQLAAKAWSKKDSNHNGKKNERSKSERWSTELRALVPLDMWKGDHIADEYFVDALELTLTKLFDVAYEHGYVMLWDIDLVEPNARADNSLQGGSEDRFSSTDTRDYTNDSDYYGSARPDWHDDEWRKKQLLPGWSEVIDE